MNASSFNILCVGVGGQGVLYVSKIISNTAKQNYSFSSRTENRGLSQRGGSVISTVRFGPTPLPPCIVEGGADLILSLDLLEAVRYQDQLKSDGVLLSSANWTPPAHIWNAWSKKQSLRKNIGLKQSEFLHQLKSTSHSYFLDIKKLNSSPGKKVNANAALIGAASEFLPFPEAHFKSAFSQNHSSMEVNARSFDLGKLQINSILSAKSTKSQRSIDSAA